EKSEPRCAKKPRQRKKNRPRTREPEKTFAKASEGRANPEASKPPPPMTTALIAAQSAENRARDKRADERFGHDDAGEQKCAAAAEVYQTGNETAPVVRELFPNQKNQGNQSDRRQRTRKPRRCSVYAEKLERDNN